MGCVKLHEVLRIALDLGNLINHGSLDGAQCFPISQFSTFAAFKVGKRSTLHYICSSLASAGDFLAELEGSLSQVFEASRGSSAGQQEEQQALQALAEDLSRHIAAEHDAVAKARAQKLREEVESWQARVKQEESAATVAVRETQRFLGEREHAVISSEEFFGHVVDLVRRLQTAAREVAKQRAADAARQERPSDLFSMASSAPPDGTPRSAETSTALLSATPALSPAPSPEPLRRGAAEQGCLGTPTPSPSPAPSPGAEEDLFGPDGQQVCLRRRKEVKYVPPSPRVVSWLADGRGVQGAIQALNTYTVPLWTEDDMPLGMPPAIPATPQPPIAG